MASLKKKEEGDVESCGLEASSETTRACKGDEDKGDDAAAALAMTVAAGDAGDVRAMGIAEDDLGTPAALAGWVAARADGMVVG